nr:hypothetical protein [uncultured Catenibacterium sp.]
MELVSDEKLEAVADFLADDEVFGIAPCSHFNNSLKRNRVNVPCDIGDCDGDCPFYSKENFLNWIKEPNKRFSVEDLKRPKAIDFVEYINNDDAAPIDYPNYAEALERYCTDLENLFADLEYDLETAECENRTLVDKLSKIRGVLDEHY